MNPKVVKAQKRKTSNDKIIPASTARNSRENMLLPEINRTFPYELPVIVKLNKRKHDPRKKLSLIQRPVM